MRSIERAEQEGGIFESVYSFQILSGVLGDEMHASRSCPIMLISVAEAHSFVHLK